MEKQRQDTCMIGERGRDRIHDIWRDKIHDIWRGRDKIHDIWRGREGQDT